jgi:serine/threonine protein kinase
MDEILRAGLADRYDVDREVGSGAMATVYRAQDLKHGRTVAIKVLDQTQAALMGPTRFLREIVCVAGLQHPHILPLYDSGETAGFFWFTMPYVKGESLRARLEREGRVSADQAVPIICEAAEALDFAHRHGVLHRDVKPDNIMLTEGHALVADFGVARRVDLSVQPTVITAAGMVLGTPAYMSPEQAMGDPIDARSDLYSLGLVLYEMLAGGLPLPSATDELLEVKERSTHSIPLPPLGREVPGPIRRVAMKAMAPRPDDRFQSGAEMSQALRNAAAGTYSSGSFAMPARHVVRRRALLLVTGVVVIASGVVTARGCWGP